VLEILADDGGRSAAAELGAELAAAGGAREAVSLVDPRDRAK
jgi:hypothetical protein